jgi:hypothetical protein
MIAFDRSPYVQPREFLALDRANISVRGYDKDRRLHVAMTNLSKANICPYYGSEIPGAEALGLDPRKLYRLLRAPEELQKAASTFNNLPILIKHVPVTAEDHQPDLIVGTTGTDANYAHPYLRNSMAVWAKPSIDRINDNSQRELSCGYHFTADMTPGVYEGQPYDGVMRNLYGNHVALVESGRAGPDVVVGDSALKLRGQFTMSNAASKAAQVQGALVAFLRPVIAMDTSVDLTPIVAGLTEENYVARIPAIIDGVVVECTGKMAQDASLEELTALLHSLASMAAAGAHGAPGARPGLPGAPAPRPGPPVAPGMKEATDAGREPAGATTGNTATRNPFPSGGSATPTPPSRPAELGSGSWANPGTRDYSGTYPGSNQGERGIGSGPTPGSASSVVGAQAPAVPTPHTSALAGIPAAAGSTIGAQAPLSSYASNDVDDAAPGSQGAPPPGGPPAEGAPPPGGHPGAEQAPAMKGLPDAASAFLADILTPEDYQQLQAIIEQAHAGPAAPAAGAPHQEGGAPTQPNMGVPGQPEKPKEHMMTKPAMDASAVDAAIKAAVLQERQRASDIRDAERAVRPYVGELTIACDSAEGVYRAALKGMGVNVDNINEMVALKTILELQPISGSAKPNKIALDSYRDAEKEFAEMFPGVPLPVQA